MKRLVLLLILACFGLFSCNTDNDGSKVPENWKTYEIKKTALNFSVARPPDWEMHMGNQYGLLFNFMSQPTDSLDKMNENVNMIFLDLPKGVRDLPTFIGYIERKFQDNYTEAEEISSEPADFHGIPAQFMKYKMTFNELPLILDQYVFLYDTTGYVWTYAAESARYGQYKPKADSIFATFKQLK